MSSIFLSHSSADNFEAVALRDWLASEGWDDVFLDLDPERGIAAGERWERELHEAANRCEAVVFLISSHWLASGWCRKEYELARGLNKKLFAGIVGSGLTITGLPLELKDTWQAVDLVGGQDLQLYRATLPGSHEEKQVGFSRDGLRRLKRGLEKAGLDPKFFAWPPETDRERTPYRGLKPLEGVDAGIFFGREAPIVEATDRLRGVKAGAPPRLLVILGASGAGKSSFLRAGLLPRLARDDHNFLPLPVIRPERAALTGENGLLHALEAAAPSRTRPEIRAAIQAGAAGVRALLAELVSESVKGAFAAQDGAMPPAVVIAIDQAEELFRPEGAAEGATLLELVRDLTSEDAPTVIAIFAIRADSYDALEHAKPLAGLAQSTLPLLPMPRGAYKDVIEGPARRYTGAGRTLTIEPQLTQRLLEDIDKGGGSDSLPLLAVTLEQLFLDYRRSGVLRLKNYEDFGGLKGAIDAAVARAFARADADARIPKERRARELLLRRGLIPWLAGIDPDSRTPRRNIARRADIPEEAAPLIDLLVEERLLATDTVATKDAATGAESRIVTIEPAHEALLRQWGLLQGWLDEDFGLLATLEGVKRAARDWDANGMAEGWLAHQGGRLAEARALDVRPDLAAQLEARDRAYLENCGAREAAAAAERENARANELARAKAEAERAKAEADHATAQARFSRNLTRVVGGAAMLLALVAVASIALGVLAKREATRAEESYQVARQAANGLIVDIAGGLRNVEGMPTASVERILSTAKSVIDRLTSSAPDDPELAKSRISMLRQFATNYTALGDLAAALEAAEASVEGARRIDEAASDDASRQLLAYSLNALGNVQRGKGTLDTARASYDEAIAIADKMILTASGKATGQEIKARTLNELSNLEVVQGETANALAAATASVSIARALSAADPSKASWRILLADGLERAGNISGGITTAWTQTIKIDAAQPTDRAGLDYPTTLSSYEESRAILQALVTENPTNTDFRARLENILIRIGDLRLAMGAIAEALSAHKEALAISSELLSQDSGNTEWKRRVQVNYQKLQSVYAAQGDKDAALTAAQESLEIAKRLIDIDPGNLLWRHDLCARYGGLGGAQRAEGDDVGARDNHRKAIEFCRETASRYPSDVQSQLRLAGALYGASKGRSADEALPLLREALGILENLDRAGALPKANASWAPFIRDKIVGLANSGASK
jgi:tetratricopeptide (TPR) repeat protein